MAKYMIYKVDTMRTANKAQEYVFKHMQGLQHMTIEDDADLIVFQDSINEVIKESMTAHPRCSEIKMALSEDYTGGYSLILRAGKFEGYIASVKIVEIKTNWKYR